MVCFIGRIPYIFSSSVILVTGTIVAVAVAVALQLQLTVITDPNARTELLATGKEW